jgi:uncharacterized membrane protein
MSKTGWLLTAILILGLALRLIYCWNLPLSGDESISVLQAAGKALDYPKSIPLSPTPVQQLQTLLQYSPDRGVSDVLQSMEKTGMHPPFYYLLLHFVLKYVGNEVLLLRILSVVFSVLSIGMIFLIGKKLACRPGALWAAALLAVSAYGVHFALMIRPYPMAMFLSLFSFWLILIYLESTCKKEALFAYAGFVLTALIGLYSIYPFGFVFLFLLAFLVLYKPNQMKNWLAAGVAGCLAVLLYLPWLPSFREQLKAVRSGDYYFYGTSSILRWLEFLFSCNFSEFLPGTYALYKFLILALVSGIGIAGGLHLMKNRIGRTFLLAFGAYAAAYYLADRFLQMKTLNSSHFQFFTVPAVFLILSAGLTRCSPKLLQPAAALLLFVLGFNLFRSFAIPRTHDGPHCTQKFTQAVQAYSQGSSGLLLFNNSHPRLLLATISPLQTPVDAVVAPRASYLPTLQRLEQLSSYNVLFFPVHDSPDVSWNPDEQSLNRLQDYLEERGYSLREKIDDPFSSKTYMLIFKRSSPIPPPKDPAAETALTEEDPNAPADTAAPSSNTPDHTHSFGEN